MAWPIMYGMYRLGSRRMYQWCPPAAVTMCTTHFTRWLILEFRNDGDSVENAKTFIDTHSNILTLNMCIGCEQKR